MNSGDQLTERVKKHTQSQVVIEEEEFTYSDNGHMTSRVLTIGGNDYTTSYQYDVGGNLKQVTLPNSATVTYQYDAYGNRVKKQTSTEKVSYEYAGGSCQREIHRNLSDTILYTLRYYPWGFTKTVPGTPDVTTTYYYLVDTRGWVWGLTDSDGIILETYQYSPYGELLSTPSITHSRFLSGADECLWDSETGLYYLHARYYDPQLGRFIQEDIVEGDLESPASQNRYTYCQNDPVSLVDPSGYSPQNTNTPSRFGQFNIANLNSPYGCSLSDLQVHLPEMKVLRAEDVNVIGEYPHTLGWDNRGHDDMMGGNDGCTKLENHVTELDSLTTEDGTIVKLYKVEIDGETIYVVQVGNGKPIAYGNMLDPKNMAIANGLNAGFDDISRRGGNWSDINVSDLLNDIANFTNNNISSWKKIYTGEDVLFTFIKHATVGGAIKQAMKNDGTYGGDKGQYNMMIGFWTSYYVSENEKNGWDIQWDSNIKYNVDGTIDAKNSTFGIVDIARLMRAVMWKENYSGVFDNTKVNNGDYGLMQVNKDSFINGFDDDGNISNHKGILYTSPLFKKLGGYKNNESLWQTNIFGNIGAGIGIIFGQTCRSNGICYGSPSPSVWNWLNNNEGKSFIRGYNPKSETDVIKVRNLFTIITNDKYRFQKGTW